ncbi:sialate:O-sulfotransferase 1-like [Glandiceps talaboti]
MTGKRFSIAKVIFACALSLPIFVYLLIINNHLIQLPLIAPRIGHRSKQRTNARPFEELTSEDDESRCNISLSPVHTHPIIALASFPGSGNTWTRHLIQQATGIYTGSVYRDGDIMKNGFDGEREDYRLGSTLTVKTHRFNTSEYAAAILLLRDPYKAYIAEFNRRKTTGHTGNAPFSEFLSKDWHNFVTRQSARWENHTVSWIHCEKPLLVVKYSDLKCCTMAEVGKIVKFVGFEFSATRRTCVENNIHGAFKRTGQAVSLPDPFTSAMHKNIDKKIAAVNKMLVEKGYKELEREV